MRGIAIVISLVGLIVICCSQDMSDDPIPFVPFAPVTINTNLPQYQSLRTSGFAYIDGGVRGIIIYRSNAGFRAYERNCSYQPNEACATIEMHTSTLYMYDPCCNSTFELSTGEPSGGPAWRPLRQYMVVESGSEVTIYDDIIN